MDYIEYDGQKYFEIDNVLAMMRRHASRLKPVFLQQALAVQYTHLEVYKGYWISKDYEPWLRAYMQYFMYADNCSITKKQRETLLYPFLMALYRGGVPYMEWCKDLTGSHIIYDFMEVEVITKESHPNYFNNSKKIKTALAFKNEWNVLTYNYTILETLKAIHKKNLKVFSEDEQVLAMCNQMGITAYFSDKDLAARPTFMEVSKCRNLTKVSTGIYNWDKCLVLK